MAQKNGAIDRAVALVEQGIDRSIVASLMGYPSVQYVHNLVYQAKLRDRRRAAQVANPALDRSRKNVERVRKYLTEYPLAMRKQIMIDLKISQHTVERAIKIIQAME